MASVVTSKSIQIAGGGIAGLTAAIQLKKYGFDPIVFEKDLQIGGSRHGDYEGLENWIFSQHIPSFMDDLVLILIQLLHIQSIVFWFIPRITSHY